MRKSQVQEEQEEIKSFLLRNLSNVESKLGKYHSELKRVKWTFQNLNQNQKQEHTRSVQVFHVLKDAQNMFSSILDRYETLNLTNEELQRQVEKYKEFQEFTEKQTKNLKQESLGHYKNMQMYANKLNDLRNGLRNRGMEMNNLKLANLHLLKHVQKCQIQDTQVKSQAINHCDEYNVKNKREIKGQLGAVFLNLKKVLNSNYSLVKKSGKRVNDSLKAIHNNIHKIEALKKDLENIQVHERSEYMWNIWRKSDHEELMDKVDSIAQKVEGVENELKSYKSLVEECNETLNKYEENYQGLMASLENLEGCVNSTQEYEGSFTEELEEELKSLKESERSYKEQISMLKAQLEKQRSIEQQSKRKLDDLTRKGKQDQSSMQTEKNKEALELDKRNMSHYQEFPLTKSSRATEFDPYKYNKNMQRRSE